MQLIKPTLIYEYRSKALLPPPPLPFLSSAFSVSQKDYDKFQNLANTTNTEDTYCANKKRLLIFIGGFCDCIMRAVYREFESFQCDKESIKIYISFPCRAFLASWLPLLRNQFQIYIIAHSWGARNAYWAIKDYERDNQICLDSEMSIEYFLTLDPVGYHVPTSSLQCVKLWENVYIKGKRQIGEILSHRPNFAAFVGYAWDSVKYAHANYAIYPPSHHASISPMLLASSFYTKTDG